MPSSFSAHFAQQYDSLRKQQDSNIVTASIMVLIRSVNRLGTDYHTKHAA